MSEASASSDTPEVRIVSGSPAPDEEAAVREAILRLWREDRAKAARATKQSRWVRAARAAATQDALSTDRGWPSSR